MKFYETYIFTFLQGFKKAKLASSESVEYLQNQINSLSERLDALETPTEPGEPDISEEDPTEEPNHPEIPRSQPEGLRWTKVDRGEAITFCIQDENPMVSEYGVRPLLEEILQDIENNCSARFVEVLSHDCDISFNFSEIDQQGGILGRVFLPNSGLDVGVCNCGDVFLDSNERWNETMLYLVLAHELFHSLGVFHLDTNETSIMNPFLNISLGRNYKIKDDRFVKDQLTLKYPINN